MSNYIKVSVPKMKSKGESIQDSIENSMKVVEQLQASIIKLDKAWDGEAWRAFKNQFYSDIEYINETYQWLKKYLDALAKAEEKYLKGDQSNYDEIKGVKI